MIFKIQGYLNGQREPKTDPEQQFFKSIPDAKAHIDSLQDPDINFLIVKEHEFCNQCGENVTPGSGNFVNRVPDLNSVKSRIENNRRYPEGDFVCAECDAKTSDTVESMICPHCKQAITYLETVELASCDLSLEPRNEAGLDIKYSCYECGKEIELKDIPGQDYYEL